MSEPKEREKKISKLKAAFKRDGFRVGDEDIFTFQERIGLRAHHETAVNYETGKPKKAYYVEGSPYEMGYLLGLMAEEEIALMTTKFVEFIPFAYFRLKVSPGLIEKIIHNMLMKVMKCWARGMRRDIPSEYQEEMRGILAGCQAAAEKSGQETEVKKDDLWLLNVGIDAIFAHVYTGKLFGLQRIFGKRFKLPFCCNAFSVFAGAAKDDSHFFGRDFMFEEAGVFHKVACYIIHNPLDQGEGKPQPIANHTAPGLVGTVAGINKSGVAIGVNILPSAACNSRRPGLNSLLLARHSIQYGSSADEVVEIIARAPRGVSWLYPIADGANNKAGVVEAHCRIDKTEDQLVRYLLSFPPRKYKKWLPDKKFIKKSLQNYSDKDRELLCKGLMVRWSGYRYPEEYLEFNKGLWDQFNRNLFQLYKVKYPEDFAERSYINKYYTDEDCPSNFYFAPQRETRDDVVIATNHCLIPEMWLPSMHKWTAFVSNWQINDIQWRYDALSDLLLEKLDAGGEGGGIDYETAKGLIDFLSPKRKYFPCYYDRQERSPDCREIAISGSISIFDMKKKTIESQFGYYCDEWVKVTLPHYIDSDDNQ